jgi:hypothetical protein
LIDAGPAQAADKVASPLEMLRALISVAALSAIARSAINILAGPNDRDRQAAAPSPDAVDPRTLLTISANRLKSNHRNSAGRLLLRVEMFARSDELPRKIET